LVEVKPRLRELSPREFEGHFGSCFVAYLDPQGQQNPATMWTIYRSLRAALPGICSAPGTELYIALIGLDFYNLEHSPHRMSLLRSIKQVTDRHHPRGVSRAR
jgi:hypothetical protein